MFRPHMMVSRVVWAFDGEVKQTQGLKEHSVYRWGSIFSFDCRPIHRDMGRRQVLEGRDPPTPPPAPLFSALWVRFPEEFVSPSETLCPGRGHFCREG